MIDVLAPLGLLGLVLLVVAFVVAARKQQRERARPFQELAERREWRYLPQDDGTARSLAEGFEGFARFRYASGAPRLPSSVVSGEAGRRRICLFLQGTRTTEGDARQWTVCIVSAGSDLARPERPRHRPPSLGYDVEVQVRGRRLAASLAGRNDEIESVEQLQALAEFTLSLADELAGMSA